MEGKLTAISRQEALRYVGCPEGPAPAEISTLLEEAVAQVMALAQPRVIWREFPLEKGNKLVGTDFTLEGEEIKALLADCDRCILMAATLGGQVEQKLRTWQLTDMTKALLLDGCASAAIENVCDNLERELAQQYLNQGDYLTDRFSPGYGDMPITQQGGFCGVLDTQRRMGLCVSSSGLLIPRKSVTAVMGVAKTPQPHRGGSCAGCRLMADCGFRKRGTTCYGKKL